MKPTTSLLRTICALATSAALTAAEVPPVLKTEHFDRDPGWEGVNNRVQTKPKAAAR